MDLSAEAQTYAIDNVWIKSEPVDTESTTYFQIKCEDGGESIVKIESTTESAVDPFAIERSLSPEIVSIKTETTEITLGEYECGPAPVSIGPQISENRKGKAENVNKRQFSCGECGAFFARKDYYEIHRRKHTGELPFACDLCPKRFSRKESLSKHLRLHTGIKPYACDICGMRFAQNGHVKPHKLTHEIGEKPFPCNICEAKFTRNSALKVHKMKHIGETRFTCEVCNKGFTRKEYLVNHARVHTGEKPFRCEACGKQYSQKAHLDHHRHTTHTTNIKIN